MGPDRDPVRDGDGHGERRDAAAAACGDGTRYPGARADPRPPSDFSIDGRQALRIADTDPNVIGERAPPRRLTASVETEPSALGGRLLRRRARRWCWSSSTASRGEIENSWTGSQVAWPMARGRQGQFGHLLNAPYVWIPMALVFFFALFDLRRPGRIAHLDLLVLLSFGISHVFFNAAEIGVSVPLYYPPLLYLLARMLWIGFRGADAALRPTLPSLGCDRPLRLLAVFRVTLNIADSGVIDVGYAGVIGADRITDAEPIYGEGAFPDNNPTGDTYGPANYFAYVPFEQIFPWSGSLGRAARRPRGGDLLRPALRRSASSSSAAGSRATGWRRPWRSPGSPTPTRTSSCSRTRTTRCSRRC